MYHANNEDFFRLQVPSMNKIATDNIIKFYFKNKKKLFIPPITKRLNKALKQKK